MGYSFWVILDRQGWMVILKTLPLNNDMKRFFLFWLSAEEQGNEPKCSTQSWGEPKIFIPYKLWEAADLWLADKICLFGLQQLEPQEMQSSEPSEIAAGDNKAFSLGRTQGTGSAFLGQDRWTYRNLLVDMCMAHWAESCFWNRETGKQLLTCRHQPPTLVALGIPVLVLLSRLPVLFQNNLNGVRTRGNSHADCSFIWRIWLWTSALLALLALGPCYSSSPLWIPQALLQSQSCAQDILTRVTAFEALGMFLLTAVSNFWAQKW